MLPSLVAHADWSIGSAKRWMAVAERAGGGRYDAHGPERVDNAAGLFGMLEVVLGARPSGEPEDERVRRLEGWILGQAPV